MPRQQHGGPYAGQLVWRKPTQAALIEILHNPAYAGAFVYGRKGPHPDRRPGQLCQIRRPMEEWTTILKGCILHIAVGTSFWRIKRGLSDNASDFARRAHGAPRRGCALLAGLVVCGRGGYQMRVNTEMLVKLHRLGYKWIEVPVNHFPAQATRRVEQICASSCALSQS